MQICLGPQDERDAWYFASTHSCRPKRLAPGHGRQTRERTHRYVRGCPRALFCQHWGTKDSPSVRHGDLTSTHRAHEVHGQEPGWPSTCASEVETSDSRRKRRPVNDRGRCSLEMIRKTLA